MILHIGTYTVKGGEGIYRCSFDPQTGAIEVTGTTSGIANPTFLARHPSRPLLYSVSEVREHGTRSGGAVFAFTADRETGELALINHQPSGGQGPCHVAVSPNGTWVAAANYASGSVSLLRTDSDGSLSSATSVVQHEGSSVHPQRQQGPHAHSAAFSADSRLLYVADLGLDRLMIYRITDKGGLESADPPWFQTHPGAGPRHFDFHPGQPMAYLINEIDSTLTALRLDPGTGALQETARYTTLPPDFDGDNTTADIHVHPSGRYVYGSNRGHDSIVGFCVDAEDGVLSNPRWWPTEGANPRNFAIAPDGAFLLAANQDGDTVVLFAIDPDTGDLTPTGHSCTIPAPVCIRFA